MASFSSKQPWEEYYVAFDFTNVIGSASIATATAIMTDPNGTDVTATMTEAANLNIASPIVNVWIKGGTTNNDYKLTCRITTDATPQERFEYDATLPVEEI